MSSPGGGRRQTGRPWWKAVGERVPRQFGSRRTGKGNGRRTTDDRQDNRRPATDGRRQRPTADNRQPTGRRTTRRPTATTDGNDRRQDDRRPNRRPTTRRVKNKHNPRTSIPSGGYRAIGPTGGITVSERRHTSPEVGHGEGVKAGGVHPKRGRAVRKRFVLKKKKRPFVQNVCVCAIHEIVTAFGVRKERFTFVTLLNHIILYMTSSYHTNMSSLGELSSLLPLVREVSNTLYCMGSMQQFGAHITY